MREIGRVDNELDASVFRDFLFNRGLECDAEKNGDGSWSLWAHDEDRMVEVSELFARFKLNPGDRFFIDDADAGARKREEHHKEERKEARKQKLTGIGDRITSTGMGKATLAFIVMSVVVTLIIGFGKNQAAFLWLAISLPEVFSGQVWRLVTPIFMHLGIIHILFNMMWLRDLGSMIENARGSKFLVTFVLVTGVLGNLGEYFASGPFFGGMSGVVYGLLGYVWMQSKFSPWSGMVLHPFTVNMMLFWFVLCLTGLVGNIANTTHTVGLVAGCLWGYLDAKQSNG